MNWKITQIKTLDNPETGIIVNASFSVSDGTSTIESDTNLLAADSETFVSLENTTEEQLVQLVKDALDFGVIDENFSNVKNYERLVENKTKESQTQPQITPLPWA
jgi:hypothetical protein